MDFWSVYEREKVKPEFGSSRLCITSRDRIALSLSTVEQYGETLEMNRGLVKRFREEARYVLATEITHDLLVSIYDVNTTQTFLLRFSTPLPDAAVKKTIDNVKRMKKPNLEMRIIGLQNNEKDLLGALDRFHAAFRSSLMEVDLFGSEMRHIVFDIKLGMSFNLLLLNRIYRPHELVNTISIDEFNKMKSELKFV